MASAIAKTMVSDEVIANHRIWNRVKKVLERKGAEAALAELKKLRSEDALTNLFIANRIFQSEFIALDEA